MAARDRGLERRRRLRIRSPERVDRRLGRHGREEQRRSAWPAAAAPIRASTRAPSVSGIGSALARRDGRPGLGEVAGDLEGVERIAARRLLDPDQDEARERPAGPGQEQLVQRRQRQRAHVQPLAPLGGDAGRQLEDGRWRLAADGEQDACGAVDKAADRVGQDRRRGVVEPLGVVDRQDQRTLARELAQERRRRPPRASAGPEAGRTARPAGWRSRGRAAGRPAGIASSASVTVDRRSVRPPRVSVRSDSAGAARRTRAPRSFARSIAARQIAVLPIPASPSMSRLASPARARSRNRSTASTSVVRPMSSVFIQSPD